MAVAGERPGPTLGDGQEPFSPSVLGTREHWDAAYERELQTFQDIGDAGEIWFGEESMVRIIRWLEKQKVPLDSSVLDIGTGNGVLLIELAKSGYTNLTGIDYSPSAIQLSEKVREKEGMSDIKLKVEDFLTPSAELSGFDICIDKGTFDAISLNPDNAVAKRKQYVRSLCSVLKPEGFFLITSCNWTKEELLNEFREAVVWFPCSLITLARGKKPTCCARFGWDGWKPVIVGADCVSSLSPERNHADVASDAAEDPRPPSVWQNAAQLAFCQTPLPELPGRKRQSHCQHHFLRAKMLRQSTSAPTLSFPSLSAARV
ncbi:EEF1A lysine methyltransferase 2 isoform 2-T2 [Chlamydotis macqueenii]